MLSFVTPNYNDGNTIERQVDSIMDQDYKYIEQIIVDDGSTDDSKEVLEKLQKKYPDRLKVIFLKQNQGACEARNIGAEEATGKYLSFLPADAKLYPGVARIWVETLEENPEYDFMYGGYKFTDEEYNEIFNYMGDHFDPYFLKVSNYIDGSYPLKKELFDKMGGWDPAIKSLQDWDLWLNAVINHDAKGLYKQEVYFETTMPHPGGLSDDSHRNWIDRTTAIKRKYGIKQKKICVTGAGASFHAKNIAKMLDADFLPVPSFKPHKYEMIYVVGFFGNVAESFYNTNALRVVHWIGSDILSLQTADDKTRDGVISWLDNNVDVHLCEFEQTKKELEALGIHAKIVPFPPQKMYEPMPLPEKFTVACYIPQNNAEFYCPDLIKGIAKKNKDIDFKFFGDPTLHGKKDNIEHMGFLNKEEIEDLVKNSSCILRVTPHDGLPLSVIEWVTAGRSAITTVKLPHTITTKPDEKSILAAIEKAKKAKLNVEGSKHFRELCDEKTYRDKMYSFLDQDLQAWWDKMSEIWEGMESNQETTDDIATIIKEMKRMKPENVIDLGCGTGRFADLLPITDYEGMDFAEDLVMLARNKHPDYKFHISSFKDFKGKYDVAFTFASLLHLKPEEMEENVKAIKKVAKRAMFIEPVREATNAGKERQVHPKIIQMQKEDPNFIFNTKYTWVHDYMKHFKVERVIQMSHNRNMFIVDLT